ncbi:MAG: DUF5990 family protein [Ferruginibacter sp.]
MENELRCRIILQNPTPGVDFGLQKGKGNNFETIQIQKSGGNDLLFEFSLWVKSGTNKSPVFLGPFAQGTPIDRFIYIDIGKCAGQRDSSWSRRLKIPLSGIIPEMIQQLLSDSKLIIETLVAGIGKDGGPNCGTVKPFKGWVVKTLIP